jgi:hypothetical protein
MSRTLAAFATTGTAFSACGNPQISGTSPNDFTNPVIYSVRAVDGDAVNYTVSVTVLL